MELFRRSSFFYLYRNTKSYNGLRFFNGCCIKSRPFFVMLQNKNVPVTLQIKRFAAGKAAEESSAATDLSQSPHFRRGRETVSDNNLLETIKKYKGIYDPSTVGETPDEPALGVYNLPHKIWSKREMEDVSEVHRPPEGFVEHWAYFSVQCIAFLYDVFSGYKFGSMTEKKWLIRITFTETLAGVPGMVGAMVRHLGSLRTLRRDHGWIHTLLEEAENERMHLMTILYLYNPGTLFRLAIVLTQGAFTNLFFLCYLFSPRFCHWFVGYLGEEAVKTYTRCLEDIDKPDGCLKNWKTLPAPPAAIKYWHLEKTSTMRDMILAMRADEAHHRVVNFALGTIHKEAYSPFRPGQ